MSDEGLVAVIAGELIKGAALDGFEIDVDDAKVKAVAASIAVGVELYLSDVGWDGAGR